jgi:hypothetical protein
MSPGSVSKSRGKSGRWASRSGYRPLPFEPILATGRVTGSEDESRGATHGGSAMMSQELESVVLALVADSKGSLAADD